MKTTYADAGHWATLYLIQIKPNEYIVSGWEINKKFRGQGYAAKLFDQMLKDADNEQATLILGVEPDGTGLDEIALFAFYESRGFKRIEEEFAMIRHPSKVEPNA